MYTPIEGRPPTDRSGEFASHKDTLLKQDQVPPPLDIDYLEAAAADRSRRPEQVRAHFAGVYMATAGALMPLFKGARAELEKRIAAIETRLAELRDRRSGRSEDIVTDTGEVIRWGRAALIRAVIFGGACIGLLLIGCVSLMGTLAESGYEAFDSFLVRMSFALLPALGLAAGWKLLGSLEQNVFAERIYWKRVTRVGVAAGMVWLALMGMTIGEVAWGSGTQNDLTIQGEASGMGSGVFIVIAGVLAETMVAAGCWRVVDEELNRHRSLKVSEDPVVRRLDERSGSHEARLAEAISLRDAFTGRIQAIELGCDAYAERAVAALTPRWRPPGYSGGAQSTPINPRRPDGPNVIHNGHNHPEERA